MCKGTADTKLLRFFLCSFESSELTDEVTKTLSLFLGGNKKVASIW